MRTWPGAPPRNVSNWPDREEARSMEESDWRLEIEGEAEVLEIIIVSDAVEGTFVDLDGDIRREQVETELEERDKHQAKGVRRSKVPKGKCFGWNQKKRRIT